MVYYKLNSRERSGRARFIFTIIYIRNISERDLSELVRSGTIFTGTYIRARAYKHSQFLTYTFMFFNRKIFDISKKIITFV